MGLAKVQLSDHFSCTHALVIPCVLTICCRGSVCWKIRKKKPRQSQRQQKNSTNRSKTPKKGKERGGGGSEEAIDNEVYCY